MVAAGESRISSWYGVLLLDMILTILVQSQIPASEYCAKVLSYLRSVVCGVIFVTISIIVASMYYLKTRIAHYRGYIKRRRMDEDEYNMYLE